MTGDDRVKDPEKKKGRAGKSDLPRIGVAEPSLCRAITNSQELIDAK